MTLKNQQEMSSPTKNKHNAEADTSTKKSQITEGWKYMRLQWWVPVEKG